GRPVAALAAHRDALRRAVGRDEPAALAEPRRVALLAVGIDVVALVHPRLPRRRMLGAVPLLAIVLMAGQARLRAGDLESLIVSQRQRRHKARLRRREVALAQLVQV